MEYRRDIIGEKNYASRNHNQLRHTYDAPGGCRSNLDWNLTLRQNRKKQKSNGVASEPNLHTKDLAEARKRDALAPEHPEGEYLADNEAIGRKNNRTQYQNLGNTAHMVHGLVRVSSGSANNIDWQLNLRGGLHQAEFNTSWKRHYARPQQSFDMMKENCAADNDAYQKSNITPQDRRMDRSATSINIATIRDDPISFRRWAGCEGTQVGQWRHLIEDTSRGYKSRRALQHETTYREKTGDSHGARVTDNRSEGCIVEMLGKKQWTQAKHHDPLCAKLPHGDPKLYHMTNLRILGVQDEPNRAKRIARHPRTDNDIPEFENKERRGAADA